jgi:hypothetical protein
MRMKTAGFWLLAACVALAAGPVLAGGPKTILPPEARTAPNGRDVEVLVGQTEIKSNFDPSKAEHFGASGLIVDIVESKIDSDRAKRAEMAVQPIRETLADSDIDSLATEVSRAATAALPWFHAVKVGFGRDTSTAAKLAVLDASRATEVAFFEYVYDFPPDFSFLRVQLTVSIAETATAAGQRPASRIDGRRLAYSQVIVSAVDLSSPATDPRENAALWAADNGRLAKTAITKAFAVFATLTPKALELTAAEAKAMQDKSHRLIAEGGFVGLEQENTPEGVLLFNGAYIHGITLDP